VPGEALAGYAEYRWLASRFSSGVSVKELVAIAEIAADLARVAPPSRDSKRNFQLLLGWFRAHWATVMPFLCLMNLRGEDFRVIDGYRELRETGHSRFL
jgi:hypothetical protein